MSDPSPTEIRIAPSILAADFAALGEAVASLDAAGADWIHVDVMDGHFVPNLTFGPPVIAAIRAHCSRPFDVHLMVDRPEDLLPEYVRAGADIVTVHAETCRHLDRTLETIRGLGARCGVALNPATPLAAVEEVVGIVDLVLVMTVNPGFGGQTFIPYTFDKIRRCRALLDAAGSNAELEVDGGIGPGNAGRLAAAGATAIVAGRAIFSHAGGVAEGIAELRRAARAAGRSPAGRRERGAE